MKTKTYTPKDFAWAKWTARDIRALVPQIIAHKKARYAEIKKIPKEKRTFENTVYAIESSDYKYIDQVYFINILLEASPEKHVRGASREALKILERKLIDVEYDEKVYEAVCEYAEASKKERLLPEDKKLLNDMLISYKRMGFGLPKKTREIVKKKSKILNRMAMDFSNNINDHKDHIVVKKEELDGLPEGYISNLKRNKNGGYIITLQYPDYLPFMANAKNEQRRRELNEKYLKKGGEKNMKLLRDILRLRHEIARLLGYKNHADYRTEVRMVKNSRSAFVFVNGLLKKIGKAARKDMDALQSLKKKGLGLTATRINSWDISYYDEQLNHKRFKFESEKVREYFPLEVVKNGTFKIYSKLLGVRFEKIKGYPVWHKDVELYAVKNKDNKVQSYFFLDLYPRDNKYGHAAVFGLVKGREKGYKSNEYIAPVAAMLANFPRPRKGYTSLLSHHEVETFFHEFGHVMHQVLTRAVYVSQSGTSTKRDFVEAPSQMLESWTWDRKMLKLLSSHHDTGKPLPDVIINSLLKAKNHLVCYKTARQLTFAIFDLLIHSTGAPKDTSKLFNKLVFKYQHFYMPKKAIFPAGFGHLMGYDAGYYGYMWSKVFAADMFTRFRKEGLLNPKTGGDYRREILEVGGSREEMDSVKKFLGRAPNNKAFLKEIGL